MSIVINAGDKKPHVHAELIKAWADGAIIQIPFTTGWEDCDRPCWHPASEYRIKPEPKPDVVRNVSIEFRQSKAGPYLSWDTDFNMTYPNVKLVFDGETNELKTVEILK